MARLRGGGAYGALWPRDQPLGLGRGDGGDGEIPAAIVVAAILQKGEEVRSAGGYLRSLTEKARAGQLSLGPILMALLRANMKGENRKRA